MKYTFEKIYGLAHLHLDPNKIGTELEQLANSKGHLTGDTLLDYVTDRPRSPSAKAFEWNQATAAHKYRREQARRLLAAMRIKKHGKLVHAFIHVKDKGYYTFDTVMANEELRNQHLTAALNSLNSLQARYRHLTELAKVWAAADKARRDRQKKSA